MEKGHGVGKILVPLLVIWLLILDLVMLGVALNAFNSLANNLVKGIMPQNNMIIPFVILFALIEGTFLMAAIVCGLSHAYHYNSGSVGPAIATAVIAWVVDIMTLGVVCYEINVGRQGPTQKAIESFVIIILFFETVYVFLLLGGLHCRKVGVGYSSAV